MLLLKHVEWIDNELVVRILLSIVELHHQLGIWRYCIVKSTRNLVYCWQLWCIIPGSIKYFFKLFLVAKMHCRIEVCRFSVFRNFAMAYEKCHCFSGPRRNARQCVYSNTFISKDSDREPENQSTQTYTHTHPARNIRCAKMQKKQKYCLFKLTTTSTEICSYQI